MDLYRVNVFGVPIENHTTIIRDMPAYFMADASTVSKTNAVVFQAIVEVQLLERCTSAILPSTSSRSSIRQPVSRPSGPTTITRSTDTVGHLS
ncbi:hypothetical protein DPMN_056439 [Dreissena polymorpha]|uniref:Uncharacterized protein n=1 Tax=Dreissena polymorpha TaxID=45954 RepID=A0A9D4HTH6_DREPO|nr:hypothetical protein DPMN_056439 [Dreissena polymorpha]